MGINSNIDENKIKSFGYAEFEIFLKTLLAFDYWPSNLVQQLITRLEKVTVQNFLYKANSEVIL